MEAVLHYLNAIHPLSAGLMDYLQSNLKTRELLRRDYLLRTGQVCRIICFIERGLLRCFNVTGEQEVCSWFMKEGDVIISVESFYHQKESYEAIQALEDCTLHYISYSELQHLYRTFPEFNYIGRVLTEKYYCLSEQRAYSLRMQRSDERYAYLLEHHPELLLRVPAKYLASYLGIAGETLSRIKSRKVI